MQVHIVRSAETGCEPDCHEWIAAQGRIDGSSLAQFKKVLKKLGGRKLPVLMDSSGGGVDAGLAIGRLVRAKGLDVAVTRTELVACEKGDAACRKATAGGVKLGRPVALLSKCASACVFVLAGGVQRFASTRTLVGVHQFTESRSKVLRTYRIQPQPFFGSGKPKKVLVSEKVLSTSTRQVSASDKSYRDVRKFFTEMGIGDDIMRLLMSSPSDSIRLLARDELEATKLATAWMDGEELITGVASPDMAVPGQPGVAVEGEVPDTADPTRPGAGLELMSKGPAAGAIAPATAGQ
jgi:hypothetical protein